MAIEKLYFIISILVVGAFSLTLSSCGDDEDPIIDPVPMDCDDGCEYTVDTWDETTGQCVFTLTAPDCDDNDASTMDSYNETNCTCVNTPVGTTTNTMFTVDSYSQESVQEELILMEDGDTLTFGPGTFSFTNTLSLDDKRKVLIIGAGMDETILDFSGQTAGADGFKITADSTIIANFTILNASGDALKAKDCNYISFINVGTVWDGEASQDNGAYGLYPVSCTHVLIDGCFAKGASDAGIYVGQTDKVIVKNSTADNNVAGIEIENTKNADVFDNVMTNNTGGLVIFDLPGLPAGQGSHCRAFNNTIEGNNFKNFAPAGNIVGQVPPGTGVMIMGAKNVEVFANTITNNNLMSVGIVDYQVLTTFTGATWDDPNYVTYPRGVHIHENMITRTNECPSELNPIGFILSSLFTGCEIPEILWDGVTDPAELTGDNSVCVQNSGSVINLDLGNYPGNQNMVPDYDGFDCTRDPLPPVEVLAPTL